MRKCSSVELIVNEKIRENITKIEARDVPIAEAMEKGATALFGEKYGDKVRMITFGPDYSVELCGGVHVPATGNIGQFKIVTETSVAAGIRRIEAITADTAANYLNEQEELLKQISEMLKNPKDVKQAIAQLIIDKAELQKALEKEHQQQSGALKETLLNKATEVNGVTVIIEAIELPNADSLKKALI